jgi:hypothetical protein
MARQDSGIRQVPFMRIGIWLAAATLVIGGTFLINQKHSQAAEVVVYKSPTCGCCAKWIDHLEDNGFNVEVHDRQNMKPVKDSLGIPRHLQSCHTAEVGGYLVEGHVPAGDIKRLLEERPAIKGLAVPGMPMGSPGMEGPRKDPYDVLAFDEVGNPSVYSSR